MFSDIEMIDNDIKEGRLDLQGKLELPLFGEAILFRIDISEKNGRTVFEFYLTAPNATDYKKFEVRCPSASDSNTGKYMGMQTIYRTLFDCVKADHKQITVEAAYNHAIKMLEKHSIHVRYTCIEESFIAKQGVNAGKEITVIKLKELVGIGKMPKANIVVKEKPQEETYNKEVDPF